MPSSPRPRSPYLDHQTGEKALDFRILDLIATIIGFCTPAHERGRGHPPTETIRVLATLCGSSCVRAPLGAACGRQRPGPAARPCADISGTVGTERPAGAGPGR